MKRGNGPKADAAKVRAWQQRSRERAQQRIRDRQTLAEGKPLKRGPRKRKATIPAAIRREVIRRQVGLCICGCGTPIAQLHHVLDEAKFPELAAEPWNLVGVALACHERHTVAFRRLPRGPVLAVTGRLLTTGPRQAHFDRAYPADQV